MATLADATASIAARTNTPIGRIKHISRQLQGAGYLPMAVGTAVPSIHIEHLASLLLAFLSDQQMSKVAFAVAQYEKLTPHGFDFELMPEGRRPAYRNARHYLEHVVHLVATGTPEQRAQVARLRVEAVSNWPEITITDTTDGVCERFVEPGADAKHWQSTAVRRSVTITGRALELIVGDLRLTR